MLRLFLLFLIKNRLWVTRSPKGYHGGIWAPWSMVGGWQTTNQLLGGLQTTNQLVGGLQTTSQLVGGLQTANQLVGGLQTTNHGAQIPPWCLHYGVLAFSRAGECGKPARGSWTRKIIKKPSVFKLFQKKWCWCSSFEVHLFIF